MPDAAHGQIGSTDFVMPIRQSEIYVFVPMEQAGASYGLIGALVDVSVDSVRTSKAEAAVKPLRDATVDYTYDTVLQADMKAALSQDTWLGIGDPKITREVTDDGLSNLVAGGSGGAILLTVCDYSLDNDGNMLSVTVVATMIPHNDALRALHPLKSGRIVSAQNAIYRNVFVFQTRMPGGDPSNRDVNILTWSNNHGAPLRAALDMASKKLSAMIAADIGRSPTATDPADAQPVTMKGVQGVVIATDADGQTVRFKDGTMGYYTTAVP